LLLCELCVKTLCTLCLENRFFNTKDTKILHEGHKEISENPSIIALVATKSAFSVCKIVIVVSELLIFMPLAQLLSQKGMTKARSRKILFSIVKKKSSNVKKKS